MIYFWILKDNIHVRYFINETDTLETAQNNKNYNNIIKKLKYKSLIKKS